MPNTTQAGRFIICGLEGYELKKNEIELLRRFCPAGVILFKRNIRNKAQIKTLCAQVRTVLNDAGVAQPLIAIDHEGWPVDRLGLSVTTFPALPLLARSNDAELAFAQGAIMGQELRELGINVDLAPVFDLFKSASHPVVALRSPGADPERTGKISAALMRGLESQGVLACAKHFPGIGDCVVDPHYHVPVMPEGACLWEKPDLTPFKCAQESNCSMFMVGHLVAKFTPDQKSAELSTVSADLVSLARKQMKFKGVLVTDDMFMGALTRSCSVTQACSLSLKAGFDLLLLCRPIAEQEADLTEFFASTQKQGIKQFEQKVKRLNALCAVCGVNTKKTFPCLSGAVPLLEKIRRPIKTPVFDSKKNALADCLDIFVLRARNISFPGAKKFRWDCLVTEFKKNFKGTVNSHTFFPDACASGLKDVYAAKVLKKLSTGCKNVLICWDGCCVEDVLGEIFKKLTASGNNVWLVSVVRNKNIENYRKHICAYYSVASADAASLGLAGRVICSRINND